MTSSATPTNRRPVSFVGRHLSTILGAVLLIAGWLLILQVNRWYFTAPVFFLLAGWLGVLLTARYLWQASWAVALDPADADDFWKPVGKRDELQREKRALLKAIKEIEFDHQMGKMSDEDARELTGFYRARAIEIIKALESGGERGGTSALDDRIERELRARMALAGTTSRARKSAEKASAAEKANDEPAESGRGEKPGRAARSGKATKKGKKRAAPANGAAAQTPNDLDAPAEPAEKEAR